MKKQSLIPMTPREKTLGWVYWTLQLTILPAAVLLMVEQLPVSLSDTQTNFLFFCLNFLFLTLVMGRFLTRSAKEGLRQPFRVLRQALLGYVLYWAASLIFGIAVTKLFPGFSNANDATIAQLAANDYTLTAIGTVLLAPVAEELMYRGLVFGTLYHRSRPAAYILSTALFAAVHVVGYIGDHDPLFLILSFVQYLPAGVFLAFAYGRSGNIFAPILMHMAINQTSILTMR